MAKILVVDDDQDVVESLKTVLSSANHVVTTASSGEEGLRKASAEKPELIILDVMMESIDKGFEISRRLKKSPETKKIPILMITAIQEMADMTLHASGPSDYLPVEAFFEKPIKPEELLSQVESLLSRK